MSSGSHESGGGSGGGGVGGGGGGDGGGGAGVLHKITDTTSAAGPAQNSGFFLLLNLNLY